VNVTVQALGVALGGIALSITPAALPKVTPPVEHFQDAWIDNVKAIEVYRAVRDSGLTKPRPVVTERVLPEPITVEPETLPLPKAKPKAPADVCAQHRMRKVWQGKVWRCRRA
jgi:hypothetical protein